MTVLELCSKVRSIVPGDERIRVTFWSSAAVYWLPPESDELVARLRAALGGGELIRVSYERRTARIVAAD